MLVKSKLFNCVFPAIFAGYCEMVTHRYHMLVSNDHLLIVLE